MSSVSHVGVRGRVRQPRLQDGERPLEVRGDQPLAVGGLERRPELDRARAARRRTTPGGSIAPATIVRIRAPRACRGHASMAAASRFARRARDEAIGNVAAKSPRTSAGNGTAEHRERDCEPDARTVRGSRRGTRSDRMSPSPACTSHSSRRRRASAHVVARVGARAKPSPSERELAVDEVDARPAGGQARSARRSDRAQSSSRSSDVEARLVQCPAEPDRQVPRSTTSGPLVRDRAKTCVTVNCSGSGPAGEVLHGDDLGDAASSLAASAMHDDVDALAHERVERRQRQLARRCPTAGR